MKPLSGEFALAVVLSLVVGAVSYRMVIRPIVVRIRPASQVPLREAA